MGPELISCSFSWEFTIKFQNNLGFNYRIQILSKILSQVLASKYQPCTYHRPHGCWICNSTVYINTLENVIYTQLNMHDIYRWVDYHILFLFPCASSLLFYSEPLLYRKMMLSGFPLCWSKLYPSWDIPCAFFIG